MDKKCGRNMAKPHDFKNLPKTKRIKTSAESIESVNTRHTFVTLIFGRQVKIPQPNGWSLKIPLSHLIILVGW